LGFAVSGFFGFFGNFLLFAEKFKLRLLPRISCDFPPWLFVFLVAFLVWGLKAFAAHCRMRLWDGRSRVRGSFGFALVLACDFERLSAFSARIGTSLFF
jgi:hypothetical protein